MTTNHIQFQIGMSIPEFLASVGTKAQCAKAVRHARWPQGFRCPRCNSAANCVFGHGARKLFQCLGCRHLRSLTAASVMEHTKLALASWFWRST
jgi:transposase-like protein